MITEVVMTDEIDQYRDVVSPKIISLESKTINLTTNQVREAVIEAITSLEDKGIKWSEIFNEMINLAFMRGNHQLADLMTMSANQIWEVENESNKPEGTFK